MTQEMCLVLLTLLLTTQVSVSDDLSKVSRQLSGEWASCESSTGVCIDTSKYSCSGATVSGQCPGSSSIRCCPSPSGVSAGSCSSSSGRLCKRRVDCSGAVLSGLCPGPSTVKCCSSASTPAPRSPTPSLGGTFLPKAPDTSGTLGTCTTPQDGLMGQCIDRAECTGGTFNDLCSGNSDILCCVSETISTDTPPSNPAVSLALFRSMYDNISLKRAEALWPYFLEALDFADVNTCERIAAFIAQTSHESDGLLYFEEISSGAQYEGREDLGNIYPGDGVRYKGRGPLQLTGRYNYQSAGSALGRDFESRPEQVGMPSGGFLGAAWFWKTNNVNRFSDLKTEQAFRDQTKVINGGFNGLEDRLRRWRQSLASLGC
eukprot:Plantae.Rhodophyta-Hildenbrandia_rubra.ctg512.p1 GENE.Plantae.Rhodophyta-Hildenbrandia_rubra.ctg512~~Plantae.Rhodophyta-Hildenbrandia_rubra.ctg512.p1  ORF type:complete len:374 (+),score=32.72 Plantae.Rhodophyta-Hildenbrandia_rubra.ctg512:1019-2140(+)